jgi:protoporphyrinogen oxidase
MYTCQTNATNHQTKYLYAPNKLYELPEEICIRVKQILQTAEKICTY